MLLETLDIKKNDILIYSQNLFDSQNNFTIVYKDDLFSERHKITIDQVYGLVKEFTPKNLIVYRMLTNIRNFDVYPPKYGFFISIHNVNELIYFDPVFAIKEIEEYSKLFHLSELRFRIQQVGLTTLNRTGSIANFAELYSTDMHAEEAKFQNDKIIADAILMGFKKQSRNKNAAQKKTGKNISSAEKSKDGVSDNGKKRITKSTKSGPYQQVKSISPDYTEAASKEDIRIITPGIAEDKEFDLKKIMDINYRGSAGVRNISGFSEESRENESDAIGKEIKNYAKDKKNKSEFSIFLQMKKNGKKHHSNETDLQENKNDKILNIFKSSDIPNKFYDDKEHQPVILKLDKEK